jgi:hypothetical protein
MRPSCRSGPGIVCRLLHLSDTERNFLAETSEILLPALWSYAQAATQLTHYQLAAFARAMRVLRKADLTRLSDR